jgi:hypothetical protein
MGCTVVDGSRVEKQAVAPMRDQRCLSESGAHGVEKQSGGMWRPSARDWGRRPGEITLNLDNGEEDRAATEAGCGWGMAASRGPLAFAVPSLDHREGLRVPVGGRGGHAPDAMSRWRFRMNDARGRASA